MNPRKKFRRLSPSAVLAALVLALAPVAAQAADGDILVQGSCSGTSDWKLKVGFENNNLDVVWEVDQNVVDQLWRVRVQQNGVAIFQGQEVTVPPSGSFTVDLLTADDPGDDRFVGTARNPVTGERCRGFLIFPEGPLPVGFPADE